MDEEMKPPESWRGPTLAELIGERDYTQPVQVKDDWLTWPGKEQDRPRPPPIWND